MTVVVGGVGQLFQGDLDAGRHVVERLSREGLGAGVVVEDFHYGAVAVVQRLEDLRPARLILVGGAERGRPPGTVERRAIGGLHLSVGDQQSAVEEAATGYVTIDLVIEVAFALGALPADTVAVEVEPVLLGPADRLSPEVAGAVDELASLARAEVARVGLGAAGPG